MRVDAHERAAVWRLWLGRCAAWQHRRSKRRVKGAILVQEAECELVKVVGDAPVVAHESILVDHFVAVMIDELR